MKRLLTFPILIFITVTAVLLCLRLADDARHWSHRLHRANGKDKSFAYITSEGAQKGQLYVCGVFDYMSCTWRQPALVGKPPAILRMQAADFP